MDVKENGEPKHDNRDAPKNVLVKQLSAKIEAINKQVISPGKEVDTAIAADLADIYSALENYRDVIDKFLGADIQNREMMEEALVEIESTLKHIESYSKDAHILFERMKTFYCWK